MYTLSSVAQRAGLVGVAAALVVATVFPAASAFADALNPLTERSLLLTSSAPGYVDTDGSGNSEGSPNASGTNYAPAGSGPNGKKSGETFSFKVSTDSVAQDRPIRAFTLQYCTTAAGLCKAPGDNLGDKRNDSRETNAVAHPNSRSDLELVYDGATEGVDYDVYVNNVLDTGWSLTTSNVEDTTFNNSTNGTGVTGLTGKDNFATLSKVAGASPAFNQQIRIVFKASSDRYITNPGSKEFFVKINTWDDVTARTQSNNIDGGVTVANVMTDSIHITTKVLETMSFSVGTQNRDTITLDTGSSHGKCDPILTPNGNRLQLGNQDAEYSLETGKAHDVYSYWRLSSNSSGGASVYYSGDTLKNTVGDEIADMPTETASLPGSEQFGLGFVDPGFGTEEWQDTKASDAFWHADYEDPSSYPLRTLASQTGVDPFDDLAAQSAADRYDEAEGTIDNGAGGEGTAKFRFVKSSLRTPELIAQQNETVISCATAKMRYVANIGADTPAGVYTTKINYLAAPQY